MEEMLANREGTKKGKRLNGRTGANSSMDKHHYSASPSVEKNHNASAKGGSNTLKTLQTSDHAKDKTKNDHHEDPVHPKEDHHGNHHKEKAAKTENDHKFTEEERSRFKKQHVAELQQKQVHYIQLE